MKSVGMTQPRCIRIFNTLEKAKFAQDILARENIHSLIKEDAFGTLTLKELDMEPRFRLYIEQGDIKKAGLFLAKEMRKIQTK